MADDDLFSDPRMPARLRKQPAARDDPLFSDPRMPAHLRTVKTQQQDMTLQRGAQQTGDMLRTQGIAQYDVKADQATPEAAKEISDAVSQTPFPQEETVPTMTYAEAAQRVRAGKGKLVGQGLGSMKGVMLVGPSNEPLGLLEEGEEFPAGAVEENTAAQRIFGPADTLQQAVTKHVLRKIEDPVAEKKGKLVDAFAAKASTATPADTLDLLKNLQTEEDKVVGVRGLARESGRQAGMRSPVAAVNDARMMMRGLSVVPEIQRVANLGQAALAESMAKNPDMAMHEQAQQEQGARSQLSTLQARQGVLGGAPGTPAAPPESAPSMRDVLLEAAKQDRKRAEDLAREAEELRTDPWSYVPKNVNAVDAEWNRTLERQGLPRGPSIVQELGAEAGAARGAAIGMTGQTVMPTAANAVVAGAKALPRALEQAADSPLGLKMRRAAMDVPAVRNAANVLTDTPSKLALPSEQSGQIWLAERAGEQAPQIVERQLLTEMDRRIPGWAQLPAGDKQAILNYEVPRSDAGRAMFSTLNEAWRVQHDPRLMAQASPAAQDVLSRWAGARHDLSEALGITNPNAFHTIRGQNFTAADRGVVGTQAAMDRVDEAARTNAAAADSAVRVLDDGSIAAKSVDPAQVTRNVSPEEFASSPVGAGLIAEGKAAYRQIREPAVAEAKSALARAEQEAAAAAGIPDEIVPGATQRAEALRRVVMKQGTDADYARLLAAKNQVFMRSVDALDALGERQATAARRAMDDLVSAGRAASDKQSAVARSGMEKLASADRAAMDSVASHYERVADARSAASAKTSAERAAGRVDTMIEKRVQDAIKKYGLDENAESWLRDQVWSHPEQFGIKDVDSLRSVARAPAPRKPQVARGKALSASMNQRDIMKSADDAQRKVSDASSGRLEATRWNAMEAQTRSAKAMRPAAELEDALFSAENRTMSAMGIPPSRRDAVRRLARQMMSGTPEPLVSQQLADDLLKGAGQTRGASLADRKAAENYAVREMFSGTRAAARDVDAAAELPLSQVSGSAARTSIGAIDQLNTLKNVVTHGGTPNAQLVAEIEKRIDGGNLLASALESAKRGAQGFPRERWTMELASDLGGASRGTLDDYLRQRISEGALTAEDATRVVALRDGRGAVRGARLELPTKVADALRNDDAVILLATHRGGGVPLAGASSEVVDAETVRRMANLLDRAPRSRIVLIDAPTEDIAKRLNGQVVDRWYARAMLEAQAASRGKEADSGFAKVLSAVFGSPQWNYAMTVGRPGFQAKNLTNETMRMLADEPDVMRSRDLALRIMEAPLDDSKYGRMHQDMLRISGAGRGFVGEVTRQAHGAPDSMFGRALGRYSDTARKAVDAPFKAAQRPGELVNEAADAAFQQAIFGRRLPPGYRTEDGLRIMLAAHKRYAVGMSLAEAGRGTQRALMNFGVSNMLTRNAKPLVPFVKYYVGSVTGAVHLMAKSPKQLRMLNNWTLALQANDRAAAGDLQAVSPRLRTDAEAAGFQQLVRDEGGQLRSYQVDTVPNEAANLAGMVSAGVSPEPGERGAYGLAGPFITETAIQLTGKDPGTGRWAIPFATQEQGDAVTAAAVRKFGWSARMNMPLAQALVLIERPQDYLTNPLAGQGNAGKRRDSPDLTDDEKRALLYYALRYTPYTGRIAGSPMASALLRWGLDVRGNNPASLLPESRADEIGRTWSKWLSGAATQPADAKMRQAAIAGKANKKMVKTRSAQEESILKAGKASMEE